MQGLDWGVGGERPRDTLCAFDSTITQSDAARGERRLWLRSRSAVASPMEASCAGAPAWCRALCHRVPDGRVGKLRSAPLAPEGAAEPLAQPDPLRQVPLAR